MKKSHLRGIAALMATAVSLCSAGSVFGAAAADTEEKKEVRIVYEWEEEGVTYSKITDITQFEPSTTDIGHINIPTGDFSKTGYSFTGWTYDGILGFKPGAFVDIPDDVDELVFHPCWSTSKDGIYTVKYVLERDGITFENPEWLEDEEYPANKVFNPNDTTVFVEKETENGTLKYISRGLTDGERVYSYGTCLVMPAHDLTLYPILYRKIQLTYFAGDVDRLNGNNTYSFERTEGTSDELAASSRFSRTGFRLTGWTSSFDGKTYGPTATVEMPGVDVTYTAVWEPNEYKVVFIPGNGGTNIKVAGVTDSDIICPEPGIEVAGKHFAGWVDSESVVYQAGDSYTIPGAMPGMGISLKAVWEDGDAPAVTTTTATTSATTTTTTTATTTGSETTTTTVTTTPPDVLSNPTDEKVVGKWALSKIADEEGNNIPLTDYSEDYFTFSADHTGSSYSMYKNEEYNDRAKWKISDSTLTVELENDLISIPNKSTINFTYNNGILQFKNSRNETYTYEKAVYGDANCDKSVTIADSVAILQCIANRDKYGLSPLGKLNADVDGESGITGKDSLTLQKLDAKLIEKLPVE
jgi:hypothetical protein